MKLINYVCAEGHESTIVDLSEEIPETFTLVGCLACGIGCPRCRFIESGARVITKEDW